MIVEYVRYEVSPEDREKLLEAYRIAGDSLKASPHCHGYELTYCTEAPSTFVLRILWDSAEGHMKGFRSSPQFKTFFAAIAPFVNQIREMRHYEHTTVRWSR